MRQQASSSTRQARAAAAALSPPAGTGQQQQQDQPAAEAEPSTAGIAAPSTCGTPQSSSRKVNCEGGRAAGARTRAGQRWERARRAAPCAAGPGRPAPAPAHSTPQQPGASMHPSSPRRSPPCAWTRGGARRSRRSASSPAGRKSGGFEASGGVGRGVRRGSQQEGRARTPAPAPAACAAHICAAGHMPRAPPAARPLPPAYLDVALGVGLERVHLGAGQGWAVQRLKAPRCAPRAASGSPAAPSVPRQQRRHAAVGPGRQSAGTQATSPHHVRDLHACALPSIKHGAGYTQPRSPAPVRPHHVRELHAVADEEDGDVVAHQVEVALAA